MRIILTKENHDETLKKFERQLLDRTAWIEYDLYCGSRYVNSCSQSKLEFVLDAYRHLGKLTLESVLVCDSDE